jgi:hypothetical protein
MDRSAVQAVVVAHLPRLSQQLGLSSWEITIGYETRGGDGDGSLQRGECTRLLDYHSAAITLNPEAFADEEGVLATLRHELFHCVLSPFDLYLGAVERSCSETPAGLLTRIWEYSVERTVAALERMYQGLISPGDII